MFSQRTTGDLFAHLLLAVSCPLTAPSTAILLVAASPIRTGTRPRADVPPSEILEGSNSGYVTIPYVEDAGEEGLFSLPVPHLV